MKAKLKHLKRGVWVFYQRKSWFVVNPNTLEHTTPILGGFRTTEIKPHGDTVVEIIAVPTLDGTLGDHSFGFLDGKLEKG